MTDTSPASSTVTNNAAQLQTRNVIPDVLPESTTLPYRLTVHWPETAQWPERVLDVPGKELDRQMTQPTPTLKVDPVPEEKTGIYTLIMTDPDLMATNDTVFGQVRHWLATDVSITSSGELSLGTEISPYVGPAPLPNYISPRPHRYVFILARAGASSSAITGDDFTELQKPYAAAFHGKQELQDLKDRWGFNAQKLLEMKDLQPVAATFMLVAGNLQSAAANAMMTAQAGVNKVLGK